MAVPVSFLPPSTLIARVEALATNSPIPAAAGVYGWWFRTVPPPIEASGCSQFDGLTLLYVGIAPKAPASNGRPPSSQTLRSRVRYHFRGNAEGSTLRKTLGVLLGSGLGIELRRVGSGKRMTFGQSGEQSLSDWLACNALVSWVEHQRPWELERDLFAALDLPLNLSDNSHSGFHGTLKALRAAAVARARELPVLGS